MTITYDYDEVTQLLNMPLVGLSDCLELDEHPREVRVEITQNDHLLAKKKRSREEEKRGREEEEVEEKSKKEEEKRS